MEHFLDALKQPPPATPAVAIPQMLREWKGMGENMLKSLVDYVSDIESREQKLIADRDSLEERLKDLEERERQSSSVCEYSNEEVERREKELDEQLKLVGEHIERLAMEHSDVNGVRLLERKKLKVIEKREKEIEQREREFSLLRDEKLREIVSKEEVFAEKVRLANEKLKEREDLCRGVIERLDSGLNMFQGLKVKIDEKFKSMTAILDEAVLIRESLEKRFEEMEKEFNSVQEDKMQELESKVRKLSDIQKEIETRVKEVDLSRESANIRFQELENMEKTFGFYQQRKLGELVLAEEKLRLVGKGFIQEVILREEKFDTQDKMMRGLLERLESARKNVSDMNTLVSERFKRKMGELEHGTGIKLEEDVVMSEEKEVEGTKNEFQLKDFGEDLVMLINDAEKDSELIGAEVFKVLFLSSDPAKLVLDAITGFCVPYLGKGDVGVNVRRKSVVLLDQLIKMSPSIQPCVKEAAIKVAGEWKLKMGSGENSLEVLGFLHLLAAYNLSSCFDKDELLSLLKTVAEHKQAPELCRILGLSENIHGFVQSLINEKRYLLASTYIHECGLESMFRQAAVLNYHDKAFASEIADLRAAIEHVIKYGLESEYSPDFLTSRIKLLEGNRASLLRNGTDAQKPGKFKRFAQNKTATKASSPALKAQKNHEHNSENGPYPSWKARNLQSKTEKHIAETKYNEVPATHSNMTSKRRKLTRGWIALRRCAPLDAVVHATN
ncbi:inactive frigida-like protein 2 [Phtheirospermum japonicum]|uniref:FRIGIDA-like protein n=1 Tax=Phtheirospermum japonicum TaxID=374723 RepID=A0A830BG73_9LAMI|nr:inactive frigida-like protein 2 [Phtheirospermum japonicum]